MEYIDKLEYLKKNILNDEFIAATALASDYEPKQLRFYIETSLEEARHSLGLINGRDPDNKVILEFGSGLGLASSVLNMCGYNIVSFEPGGLGFEKNLIVNRLIRRSLNLDYILLNDMEQLSGHRFDIIFSNNVLEHIDNIEEVLSGLNKVLNCDGIMIHNIPNYIIPYEPHFGVFFIPLFPKKTSFLIPKQITDTNLWKSINFINYFDVIRYAKQNSATVEFRRQALYKTFLRLESDKEFQERHRGIGILALFLKKTNLINLLKFLPTFLNTPMIFEWKKNA